MDVVFDRGLEWADPGAVVRHEQQHCPKRNRFKDKHREYSLGSGANISSNSGIYGNARACAAALLQARSLQRNCLGVHYWVWCQRHKQFGHTRAFAAVLTHTRSLEGEALEVHSWRWSRIRQYHDYAQACLSSYGQPQKISFPAQKSVALS